MHDFYLINVQELLKESKQMVNNYMKVTRNEVKLID
jgi:hypothetical protein